MRQAGYSLVKLYFQAAMHRQETALQQAVPDLLKKLARRVHRAATRGLPGNKLKTACDFLALMVVIQPRAPSAPAGYGTEVPRLLLGRRSLWGQVAGRHTACRPAGPGVPQRRGLAQARLQ